MKKQQLEKRLTRIFCTGMSIFYAACLVYIFFFARRRWGPIPKRNFNLIPFRYKTHYLQAYAIHTSPEYMEFYKDFIGNILLFIPFPFLLVYLLGIKSYGKLLLFSAISSFSVELIQFLFKIGVADIDDLLLNTIGACIGLLIMYAVSLRSNNPVASIREWRTVRR